MTSICLDRKEENSRTHIRSKTILKLRLAMKISLFIVTVTVYIILAIFIRTQCKIEEYLTAKSKCCAECRCDVMYAECSYFNFVCTDFLAFFFGGPLASPDVCFPLLFFAAASAFLCASYASFILLMFSLLTTV